MKDLKEFPDEVKYKVGHALYVAQLGGTHPDAKPLRGFGGASVLEVVDDFDRNTYRAVYTVKFADALYVLHAFQKKSRHGAETSVGDIELIRTRLRDAMDYHEQQRKQSSE